MKQHITFLIFAAIYASLLTGCVSNSGQAYHDSETSGALAPSDGKAMVFIYNNHNGFVGSAAPGAYAFANDVQLPGRLPNNSFISYEAAPGPLLVAMAYKAEEATPTTDTLSTVGGAVAGGVGGAALGYELNQEERHRKGININIVAGQTYYVKATYGGLVQVPTEQGEKEIQGCKWQNPSK